MAAALERREPAGAVPVWEIEFHAWDAASGQHVVLGRELERLTAAGQDRALHTNAAVMLEVSEALHFAALTGPGAYWEQAPGQLAYYVLPGEARFRQFEILSREAGDLMLVANSGGVIGADYSIEFCTQLFEAPEEVDEYCRRTLQSGVETAKRFRDLGAGAVFAAADIADNSGPFFNPDQMRRFILPYLNEWAERCKAMGLYTILHTDGQLTAYVDAIADTAVDALQAIDPVAGMDLCETRRIAGERLCLCGNIDCGVLLRGTPESVFAATRSLLLAAKDGGGLVLGASNAVQPEVPLSNYRAMIAAWSEHGGYSRSRCGARLHRVSRKLYSKPVLE